LISDLLSAREEEESKDFGYQGDDEDTDHRWRFLLRTTADSSHDIPLLTKSQTSFSPDRPQGVPGLLVEDIIHKNDIEQNSS
jgi:hypothetical protein